MKTLFHLVLLLCTCQGAFAQLPVHNSYPASNRVVLLDFDGHVVQGTPWNGSGDINCTAATLSTADITSIYNRVAEDFRPFTINITTDSAKYEAAPVDARMRVVITPSSSWYGTAGGVAYINSFTWGNNTPCFVFSALLNNNTKNIAEAVSHEIGHTLGLRHQASYDAVCNKTAEYNPGNGVGEIGWAPIMGVGYYRNMTLWNYGSNPYGCNYYQDDLSIITGNDNGIDFRQDDHGGTAAAASTVVFTGNSFSVDGIIERPADVDAMSFVLPNNGRLKLEALPYAIAAGNAGANVDLYMELLDSNGAAISVCDDAAKLQTALDTTLPAGKYYVRIQGHGNIYAPNYAVLGSYTLRGGFTSIDALPLHKLVLKGFAQNKTHQLSWEIIADERIVSQTIEASTDGRVFESMMNAPAATRTYAQPAPDASLRYYRLKVGFDNGRTYISNIVALRSDGGGRPELVSNVAQSTLMINSPSPYQYSVFDAAGNRLSAGLLMQGYNAVSLPAAAAGMYFIRYANGLQTHTERFLRR